LVVLSGLRTSSTRLLNCPINFVTVHQNVESLRGPDRCIVGRWHWHQPTREGRVGKLAPRELVVPVPRGKASRDACAVSFLLLLLPHLRLRGLAFHYYCAALQCVRDSAVCLGAHQPACVRALWLVAVSRLVAALLRPSCPAGQLRGKTRAQLARDLSTVRATISLFARMFKSYKIKIGSNLKGFRTI
jgi:hypothetical protein